MKLTTFLKHYGTDEACRAHLESVRWPKGPVCPKCGTINEASPVGNRPGLYRCAPCGSQFSVTVGTAMQGTHLPLRHWYLAMYLMLSTAKPISAMSLMRHLGIQYRTCWHLLHRLRAMLAGGEKMPLSGLIEADEPCVGGKARNLQKHRAAGARGRGTKKPMGFAAIERGGEARSAVVASAGALSLDPLMLRSFDRGSTLCTDELATYNGFGSKMRRHHAVTHAAGEYVRTEGSIRAHVNTVEGFFGLFRNGLRGMYRRGSPKPLPRDVAEHSVRYIRRADDVGGRIADGLIGRHGRLTLRALFA